MPKTKIAIFKGKEIRRYWNAKQGKWYFSVIDIVEILTDSTIEERLTRQSSTGWEDRHVPRQRRDPRDDNMGVFGNS